LRQRVWSIQFEYPELLERRDSREEEDIMRIVCGALLLRYLFIEGRELLRSHQEGADKGLKSGKKQAVVKTRS